MKGTEFMTRPLQTFGRALPSPEQALGVIADFATDSVADSFSNSVSDSFSNSVSGSFPNSVSDSVSDSFSDAFPNSVYGAAPGSPSSFAGSLAARAQKAAAPRGLSLIELLVGMAVLGVVLASVTGAVLAQRQIAAGVELGRETLDNGREALMELEKNLRIAGFGIEPSQAFDFTHFRCDPDDLVSGVGGRSICRDRKDAPDSLSFLARDPNYRIDLQGENGCLQDQGCPSGQAWLLESYDLAGEPSITLNAREDQRFLAGRVLLISCQTVARWTMVTVKTTTEASGDGPLNIPIYAGHGSDPTRENALSAACFNSSPTVFSVNRRHYSIREYDGMPWLVLDMGLDLNQDGSDPVNEVDQGDLIPIAPGIEDLQVAYVLADIGGAAYSDSDQNGVIGDDPAVLPEEPDHSAPAPAYNAGRNAATRQNLNPANIRAIRLSLVARSTRQDTGRSGDILPQSENSTRVLSDEERGEYRRVILSTTVAARNMGSRGMFTF